MHIHNDIYIYICGRLLGTPMSYRLGTITMTMLSGDPFPKLRGKASENRALLLPLSAVLDKYVRHPLVNHMKLLLLLSAKMDEIVHNSAEFRLSAAQYGEFRLAVNTYNLKLTELCNILHPKGHHLFAFTIKNHYLEHLGALAAQVNPRLGWCYKGEDMMMKVKNFARASCRGLPSSQLPSKIVEKYLQGLDVSLHV